MQGLVWEHACERCHTPLCPLDSVDDGNQESVQVTGVEESLCTESFDCEVDNLTTTKNTRNQKNTMHHISTLVESLIRWSLTLILMREGRSYFSVTPSEINWVIILLIVRFLFLDSGVSVVLDCLCC